MSVIETVAIDIQVERTLFHYDFKGIFTESRSQLLNIY